MQCLAPQEQVLVPTYNHSIVADVDSIYTSIGSGFQEFLNANRAQTGKDASNLALDDWDNTVVTFASTKFHTGDPVNRNVADMSVCCLAL